MSKKKTSTKTRCQNSGTTQYINKNSNIMILFSHFYSAKSVTFKTRLRNA